MTSQTHLTPDDLALRWKVRPLQVRRILRALYGTLAAQGRGPRWHLTAAEVARAARWKGSGADGVRVRTGKAKSARAEPAEEVVAMKSFVAVIGGRNSGKSTVIRSLTGCPTKGYRDVVTDLVSDKSIFAIAGSPQEQPLEPVEFERILEQVISEDSTLGLVMAVQPTEPRLRLSLQDIFRAVQATGRFQTTAVMLHPPYKDPDSGESPDPNDVRKRLKALNVDLHVIDGRRFAHINATAIRQLAQMP